MQELTDERAKNECVICSDHIDRRDYDIRGNFCLRCTGRCERLSKLFPDVRPAYDGPIECHNGREWNRRKKAKKLLRDRLKKWKAKKRIYERACKRFHNEIINH